MSMPEDQVITQPASNGVVVIGGGIAGVTATQLGKRRAV